MLSLPQEGTLAKLRAFLQFDYELLDLNWFERDFDSHILLQNVNNPWEDEYTIFTENEALVLHGNGFGYGGSANMNQGTVEALTGAAWDANLFAYVELFQLSRFELSAEEINNAIQTASTGDDFSLLETILSGKDLFEMSAFGDTVRGYGGADTIYGYGGNDLLMGDEGRDKLVGGSGNDKLIGGTGRDRVFGGDDNDVLLGGNGNDVLRGGAGKDKIVGGNGVDLFIFKTGDDKDFIRDFEFHFLNHDRVDLSDLKSVAGWKDLKNNHMEQIGDDVHIDGGNGDLLILRDADMSLLFKDLFVF